MNNICINARKLVLCFSLLVPSCNTGNDEEQSSNDINNDAGEQYNEDVPDPNNFLYSCYYEDPSQPDIKRCVGYEGITSLQDAQEKCSNNYILGMEIQKYFAPGTAREGGCGEIAAVSAGYCKTSAGELVWTNVSPELYDVRTDCDPGNPPSNAWVCEVAPTLVGWPSGKFICNKQKQ